MTLPESRVPHPASVGKVKVPYIIKTFHDLVSDFADHCCGDYSVISHCFPPNCILNGTVRLGFFSYKCDHDNVHHDNEADEDCS